MEWDYAKLSVLAKQNGGPNEFVEKIISASRCEGYKVGFSRGVHIGYKKGVKDTLIVLFLLVGFFLSHIYHIKFI